MYGSRRRIVFVVLMNLFAMGLVEKTIAEDATDRHFDAVMLDVRKNFCEISAGSDDGLQTGQKLEFFREGRYAGRIVIRKTIADRAIGELIRDFGGPFMQRGDIVRVRKKLVMPLVPD